MNAIVGKSSSLKSQLAQKAMFIRYPTIRRLLGNVRFEQLVTSYLKSISSVKSDSEFEIDEIGETLGAFVFGRPEAREFPYLARLCEIEWLIQTTPQFTSRCSRFKLLRQAFFANAEQFSLKLAPNVRLIESYNGEVEIWLSYQSNLTKGTMHNQLMNQYWMMSRSEQGLSLTPLPRSDFKFLSQLAQSCSVDSLARQFNILSIKPWISYLVHKKLARVLA